MSRCISERSEEDSRLKTIVSEDPTRHPTTTKKKPRSPSSSSKPQRIQKSPITKQRNLQRSLYYSYNLDLCSNRKKLNVCKRIGMNRHLGSIGKFLIQDRSSRRLVFIDWRLNRQNNKCSYRKHISKSLNIFAHLGKKVSMTKGRGDIKHCKNLRKNRQKVYKNQGLELLAGANLLQIRPLR